MRPAVSIVLPTYQRAELIGRAIRSVLAQTYQDFELLVVDDGSTDDTATVAAQFPDPRVRLLRREVNRGAAAARNVGIAATAAPFVAFQDSDDEWLPQKLERHMRAFGAAPAGVGVVYSDMERIHRDGRPAYFPSPAITAGRLLDPATGFYQVCGLGIQATVIRRECLTAIGGFNEAFPALEDLELFIRLSRQCGFRHIAEPLVRYHETDGLSRNIPAKVRARRLMLDMYAADLEREDAEFIAREGAALDAALRPRPRPQPASDP